jgi:hypothetical protein
VVMLEMLELWKGGWEAVLVESLFSRLSSVVTCEPSWPLWDTWKGGRSVSYKRSIRL